ncbi:DUF6166 domain-containing protein [Sorangium sp. So ce315]|uniref:DUF6166 domain-containing protein n=1 Tax=Sorangium sp. So ce315 TaxID=3133299 RepID=UPI003F5FB904
MSRADVTTGAPRRCRSSRLTASMPPSLPRPARQPRLAPVAYYGVRSEEHGLLVIKRSGERAELLTARDVDGAPVGLGWGYFGTGPLELASALVADACGPAAARRCGWWFCVIVTSALPSDGGWSLTQSEVRAHARAAGWRG